MRSLIIFTVSLIFFKIVGGWQYERPQDWPGICQRGQSQSPVNLEDEIYQVFCIFMYKLLEVKLLFTPAL